MFLVSHASGHIYLYNADNPSVAAAPHYQVHKTGPGFTVSNCKSKTPRNPITRWTLGEGAINEFAFSPCGQYLAAVSQDGFLRIFRYEPYIYIKLNSFEGFGSFKFKWVLSMSNMKMICIVPVPMIL